MIKINVLIDSVAALRRESGRTTPDPITAVALAELGGADSVTVSYLPAQRLYHDYEYKLIRQVTHTHLTVIMPASEEVLPRVVAIRPDLILIVPVGYQTVAAVTDWAGAAWPEKDTVGRSLDPVISAIRQEGIPVSVLIKASATDARACVQLKADCVHIDTAPFALSVNGNEEHRALIDLDAAIKVASRSGLGVSVGRGLDGSHAQDVAGIAGVDEILVGHSVIARGLALGLEQSMRDFVDRVRSATRLVVD